MSGEERFSAAAFRALCLGFSAMLLVLALFCRICLVRTREEITQLRAGLAEAQKQSVLLTARQERELSLEKLERWALLERGMQHPEPGQVSVVELLK